MGVVGGGAGMDVDHYDHVINVGNIVSITARGGDEGTFGAHKPRKGMFRTVAQLYKVTIVHMQVII